LFVLLLLGLVGLYWDTAGAIVGIWLRSEAFTHGFLVPPIVVWLVWRRRAELTAIAPKPSALGAVLLAGAAFAWLLGDLATINALTQLALVAMVVLLVPALLGFAMARAIAFPLAFLFFAVPFGEFAMPQLMEWTANFTVLALRLTGVPVYREGLQFVIPSGNWSVVEACSGVRYLIASLTVGTLFAYLNYQTMMRRVLFILVSLVVPIIANWLRAYMIVMLGHVSGNKLAAGVDHLIYGWVFFGIVIMLMFIVGARWSEPEPAMPVTRSGDIPSSPLITQPALALVAATLAVVLALPHAVHWVLQRSGNPTAVPQLAAPASLPGGWALLPNPELRWQPAFANPSAMVHTRYALGEQSVGMYLGYYRHQGSERKLVSSENMLVRYKDRQWAQVAHGSQRVAWGDRSIDMRTGELRGAPVGVGTEDERLTVWQIYWVNGHLTASDAVAKLYTAVFSLLGQGDDSAIILVYAPKGQAGRGDAALTAFMQTNASTLEALLQQAKPR
jgi:exosortase A